MKTRDEIEADFDEWLKSQEVSRLQRNKLYQAYMNLEYMQNLEGILHGYHPALGSFTMTAEEILHIYLNLFIVAEGYKKRLQEAIPTFED